MTGTDATHDASRRSWVEPANVPGCDYPIQNLPFGVFGNGLGAGYIGVAIGDRILHLPACVTGGLLAGLDRELQSACGEPGLNRLMSLGAGARRELRARIGEILDVQSDAQPSLLVPMNEAEMMLPAHIGDYTDFYTSIHHATNVGRMFRPDNPLLPNYKYVPIGYHGRASSIVRSGSAIRRPRGQVLRDANRAPEFDATRLLDYEMELGLFVGPGNELGQPVPIGEAASHLFGACLVNDWSARDIQSWEYQPLGPFLAKSFATTISPWVVSMEALAPFRVPALARPAGDPAPLAYLQSESDGGFDIHLEAYLLTAKMRESGMPPFKLGAASFANMYWTPAQLVAHHTSNGCNLRAGDLLASGTVSGPGDGERGCLLELTERGARPVELPGGEQRKFLEDGDEVILRAYCEREGYVRIGFGECRGVVLPAL